MIYGEVTLFWQAIPLIRVSYSVVLPVSEMLLDSVVLKNCSVQLLICSPFLELSE